MPSYCSFPPWLLMINHLLILLEILVYKESYGPCWFLYLILYLILASDGFIMMCLGVNLFEYVLLGDFFSFCMCRATAFVTFETFWLLFPQVSFLYSLVFWNSQSLYVDMFNGVSDFQDLFFNFFFIFNFLVFSLDNLN